MKKIVSLCLMLCTLVLTSNLLKVNATTYYQDGNYQYTFVGKSSRITKVNFYITGDVIIPDSFSGHYVGGIDQEAFLNCGKITSITMPDTVTSIYQRAFKNCTKLKSITFGNQLTHIASGAFLGCDSLTDVYYTGTLEEKNAINILSDNDALVNANWHFVQCENNGHTYADIYDAECNVCGTAKNGNINNDEIINNKDLAILMQYINGWNVSVVKKKADVNCDGFINNKDYVMLMRYINGWNIKLD